MSVLAPSKPQSKFHYSQYIRTENEPDKEGITSPPPKEETKPEAE